MTWTAVRIAEPLAVGYFNEAYPSLALAVALRALNLEPADVKVRIGESVRLGKLKIGTDAQTRMLTFYYQEQDGKPPFPVDSFFDVASGKVPLEKYRNKVVLIGPTVAGVGSTFVTPVSPEMPSVLMEAHAVSSVLSGHFFRGADLGPGGGRAGLHARGGLPDAGHAAPQGGGGGAGDAGVVGAVRGWTLPPHDHPNSSGCSSSRPACCWCWVMC